jgi:hypothetical protein
MPSNVVPIGRANQMYLCARPLELSGDDRSDDQRDRESSNKVFQWHHNTARADSLSKGVGPGSVLQTSVRQDSRGTLQMYMHWQRWIELLWAPRELAGAPRSLTVPSHVVPVGRAHQLELLARPLDFSGDDRSDDQQDRDRNSKVYLDGDLHVTVPPFQDMAVRLPMAS